MIETLTNGATALIAEILQVHGKPAMLAACASLGVWIGFGWILGPLFRLPGLRWLEPTFRALRPLLSFGVCWGLFYQLHADGVLDLGAGPTSWARAGLWAMLGAAGAQWLNHLIEKRAPGFDNEAARKMTDAAVAAVADKVRGAQPPTPPEP